MSAGRQLQDVLLERYLADALDAATRAKVEAALASSEADRRRVEELRADSAAFLTSHPPGRFAAQVAGKRRAKIWWVLSLLPAAALAGSVAFFVAGEVEPPWTVKGGITLTVHLRRGEGSVKVKSGDTVPSGAALRFEVTAPEPGFVAVLSRDGQGKVTLYHPFGAQDAGPYHPASALLETAIELEGSAGKEELFALFSVKPFKVGWAVQALQSGVELEKAAPSGVKVARVTLQIR